MHYENDIIDSSSHFALVLGRRDGFVARRVGSFLACGRVSHVAARDAIDRHASGSHRRCRLRLRPRGSHVKLAHAYSLIFSLLSGSGLDAPGFWIRNRGARPRVFVEGVILIVWLMQVTEGGVWEFEVEILLQLLTFSLSCWQLKFCEGRYDRVELEVRVCRVCPVDANSRGSCMGM